MTCSSRKPQPARITESYASALGALAAHRNCLLLALAMSSAATPAVAAPPSAAELSERTAPGAFVDSDQRTLLATALFERGQRTFVFHEYEHALEDFEASLKAFATPEARLYRARCLAQLGRPSEAFVEFGRARLEALQGVELSSEHAATAELARAERSALQIEMAMSDVRDDGPADDRSLLASTTQLSTSPRSASLERLAFAPPLKADGARPSSSATPWTAITADAPHRPYTYAAVGLSAVGFSTFAAFGILSKQTYADWLASCPEASRQPRRPCSAESATTLQKRENQRLWSNLGLALGAVGLGSAALLHLTEPAPREIPTTLSVDWSPSKISLSVKGGL